MTLPTICQEQLTKEIEKLKEALEQSHNEINYLKEQLNWFQRQLFGKRSEKIIQPPNTQVQWLPGFEVNQLESAKQDVKNIPAHTRKKPEKNGQDKITLPDNLPEEKQVIDLPENEKICKETGEPLVKIGEEITKKLAFRTGSYFIKVIVRPKYAAPKGAEPCIQTATLPETLLDRCQADESFLADLLVKKFADHLPLHRQSEILTREGIYISRQIICQWVLRCGRALKPLYDEMARLVLASQNVFADETPINLLEPGKGKAHQAYMWVLVGGKAADPPYRIYNFRTTRQHHHASDMLKEYTGVLHSDKYGAYEALANTKKLIWSPCWSHIRRKFIEAESGDMPFRQWVLRKIRYLFMFEKIAWSRSEEERLRIRHEKEIPIIDELIDAIKDKLINGKILPKSKLKEALGYFCSLIPHLKNYTQHAWSRLDNNVAERAIRPLAIGRKNWMFVGSKDGGEAAAVLFSLIQSCRAVGVNPREYLEDIMRRLMSHNSQKLYELLPDQWAQRQ